MVVRWLVRKQQEFGESDEVFARRFGLDQSTWNRIRNGHNQLVNSRIRVLCAIVAAFDPDGEELKRLLLEECAA